jgi:Fe2+ transport system protein B
MSSDGRRNQDAADFEATAAAVTGDIDEEERREPTLLERVQRTLHKYPALGTFLVLVVMVVTFSLVAPDRFLRP